MRDKHKFWSLDPKLEYALTREEHGWMPHRLFAGSGASTDRLQNLAGTMSLKHATYVCEYDWILRGKDQGEVSDRH